MEKDVLQLLEVNSLLATDCKQEKDNTNMEKMKALVDYPISKNAKDVKSLLGCASYYRRFISEFSEVALTFTRPVKGR